MSNTYWYFYVIDGEMILCNHGSERALDALLYAPGPWVSKRPLEDVIKGGDKVVGRAFVQQPGVDATEVLCKFKRLCALDVINLLNAPETVVRYLNASDESLQAEVESAVEAVMDTTLDATKAAMKAAAWATTAAMLATARAEINAAVRAAMKNGTTMKDAMKAAVDAVNVTWDAKDVVWTAAWKKQNRRLTRMLNALWKTNA